MRFRICWRDLIHNSFPMHRDIIHNSPSILITRDDRDNRFANILKKHGFTPVHFSVVQIEILPQEKIQKQLENISDFDWCIFLSAVAVRGVADAVETQDFVSLRRRVKIAAVGSETARVCRQLGLQVDFVPEKFTGKNLASAEIFRNQKVLLFQGDLVNPDFLRALAKKTKKIKSVIVYKNIALLPALADFQKILNSKITAVTFTSPSAVQNFRRALQKNNLRWPRKIPIICIGPTTAITARKNNFLVKAVAKQHTFEGMAEIINNEKLIMNSKKFKM